MIELPNKLRSWVSLPRRLRPITWCRAITFDAPFCSLQAFSARAKVQQHDHRDGIRCIR